MDNLLASIPLIKKAGMNGSTISGETPLPMVDTRDIAATAASLLMSRDFGRQSVQYVLGPRDYTLREATACLGAAVGKPDLPYVKFDSADYCKSLLQAGFSSSVADGFV
jgi:uncharacterized protein YbjT (DUF2867 family)